MKFTWPSDAVRFSVWCSTYDDFGDVKKQSIRISLKSKLLLNRKEGERVFYMKSCASSISFQGRIIWIIPISGLWKFRDKRPLPLIASRTIFKINFKTIRNLKNISTYESCASSVAFQLRITRLISTNGSNNRAKIVPKIAKISQKKHNSVI